MKAETNLQPPQAESDQSHASAGHAALHFQMRPEEMQARFRGQGYLHLPAFLGAHRGAFTALGEELISGAARRVHVGDFGQTWAEHDLRHSARIKSILASAMVHRWIEGITGLALHPVPRLWGNVYRTGESIGWHTDNSGSVQLLICLSQPAEACGGRFQVMPELESVPTEIDLQPGDGLLFLATQVTHRTTPLVSSDADRDPLRITAVARYFEDLGQSAP